MAKTKNKKSSVKQKKNKKKYKIRNWSEYNEALVNRGRIDVWVEKGIWDKWYADFTGKKKKKGSPLKYSDTAIRITLQFGQVFHQKLRQTEGLLKSIFKLMDIDLDIPDFTTLSRREEGLAVKLPKSNQEKINVIIDSSGLKVYGEGEWKVRQHGYSKHRTWRKIHLMVTPEGEIREAELTENSVSDDAVAPNLIKREEADMDKLAADGAYDKRKVYDACQEIGTIAIPPKKNARIWYHGNSDNPIHPRDKNLREIRKNGRKKWKEEIGYHIRSMGENVFFRWKTIFGDRLNARKIKNQITEAMIKASILNNMKEFGMPDSYAIS